jgi:hypothetical protein
VLSYREGLRNFNRITAEFFPGTLGS